MGTLRGFKKEKLKRSNRNSQESQCGHTKKVLYTETQREYGQPALINQAEVAHFNLSGQKLDP